MYDLLFTNFNKFGIPDLLDLDLIKIRVGLYYTLVPLVR